MTALAAILEKTEEDLPRETELHAELQKRNQQLESLARISSAVVSDLYLDEILKLLVTATAEMIRSPICSIMLLDPQRQVLVIKATQSLSESYRQKPPVRVGQSASGRAVLEKRPIAVLDVQKDPHYMYPQIAREEGLVSLLAVPMQFRGNVTGVLNIYTSTPHRFSQDEIQMVQAVADQAAVAIENTRLLSEARTLREELETRKSVERAKGLLMEARHLGEREAFRLIQKKSMESRKSMREVAEAIILTLSG